MNPAVIAAGIQAGAGLVGGLLGRNKAVKPGDVVRQTAAGIMGQAYGARKYGEQYGFNPMALLGVSQPLVPQTVDNTGFGQAIANAGLAVADGINASTAAKAYAEALEEQNKELRAALDRTTIRPKVAGIYGRAVPVAGEAEGVVTPDPTAVVLPSVVSGGSPVGGGFDIGSSTVTYGPAGADSPQAREAAALEAGAQPLMTTVTHKGETLTAPTFVDADELASGAAALAALNYKAMMRARRDQAIDWRSRMYADLDRQAKIAANIKSGGVQKRWTETEFPSKANRVWWMTR